MTKDGRARSSFAALAATTALFLAAFALPGVSRADDCDCERYRDLLEQSLLGGQVGQVGMAAMRDGSATSFYSDSERRQALRLRISADTLIPERCRAYLLGHGVPRLTLQQRNWTGDPIRAYAPASQEAWDLLNAYNALVSNAEAACAPPDTLPLPGGGTSGTPVITLHMRAPASVPGHPLAPGAGSVAIPPLAHERCIENANASFSASLMSQSPEQILQENAALGASDPLAGINADGVRVIQFYNAILNAPSAAAGLAYLRANSGQLTTDQKLSLVQMFGARFDIDYDHARVHGGPTSGGVVTMDQLLDAARHDTRIGYTGGSDPAAEFEGVCRDIASAQGQMLQAMGFRNTYVVSMAQVSGDYHVTVITQDPRVDTKVYALNYGSRTDPTAGDSRALFLGGPDAAIAYRVFLPGGRSVADVPSEFGRFMANAAGFDVRDLDPLARTPGSLLAANAAYGTRNPTQLRYGFGTDGTGARYLFVGGNQTWGDGTHAPGRVGIVLANQQRPGAAYGVPGGRDVDVDAVYAQIEQRLQTSYYRVNPRLEARIEALATAIFEAGRARQSADLGDGWSVHEGDTSYQGDGRYGAALRVNQSGWSDRFRATYRVGAQAGFGLHDVRNNESSQVPALVLNNLFFSADGRMQLSQTPEGRAYLIAATTVVLDQLGENGVGLRGEAHAGVATENFGAVATVQGRLTDGTAMIEDGSGRRAGASLVWTPSRVLRISLTGTVPIEGGDPLGGSSAMLTGTVSY